MKILILYVAECVVVNCISSTLTWHISQLIRALVWSWWKFLYWTPSVAWKAKPSGTIIESLHPRKYLKSKFLHSNELRRHHIEIGKRVVILLPFNMKKKI